MMKSPCEDHKACVIWAQIKLSETPVLLGCLLFKPSFCAIPRGVSFQFLVSSHNAFLINQSSRPSLVYIMTGPDSNILSPSPYLGYPFSHTVWLVHSLASLTHSSCSPLLWHYPVLSLCITLAPPSHSLTDLPIPFLHFLVEGRKGDMIFKAPAEPRDWNSRWVCICLQNYSPPLKLSYMLAAAKLFALQCLTRRSATKANKYHPLCFMPRNYNLQ